MANLYEVFLELEPRKRWQGVLLVVIGLILSATVGAYVDQFVARAKPDIELATIRFAGLSQKTDKFTVTPTLRKAYENAPFELEDFRQQISLDTLGSMIVTVNDYCEELPAALATLRDVESMLERSTLDADKDQLRSQLLMRWTDAPGNILEKTVRDVLLKTKRLNNLATDKRFEKYNHHPTDAPWNSPETAVVHLNAVRSYRLSDEKIFDTDDVRTRYSKFSVSLYRRLWIYLDRELFIEILKETEASLNELITDVNSFKESLVSFEETSNPKRIEVTVVVTNVGKEPLILRALGLLRLVANRKYVDVQVVATIDDITIEDGVVTIPGGEGKTLKFYSQKTLKEISEKDYAGNLEGIYRTDSLECMFGGLRVSDGTEDILITTKKRAIFGARVRETNVQNLAAKLK